MGPVQALGSMPRFRNKKPLLPAVQTLNADGLVGLKCLAWYEIYSFKYMLSMQHCRQFQPNLNIVRMFEFFPTSLCGVLVFSSASVPPPPPSSLVALSHLLSPSHSHTSHHTSHPPLLLSLSHLSLSYMPVTLKLITLITATLLLVLLVAVVVPVLAGRRVRAPWSFWFVRVRGRAAIGICTHGRYARSGRLGTLDALLL